MNPKQAAQIFAIALGSSGDESTRPDTALAFDGFKADVIQGDPNVRISGAGSAHPR